MKTTEALIDRENVEIGVPYMMATDHKRTLFIIGDTNSGEDIMDFSHMFSKILAMVNKMIQTESNLCGTNHPKIFVAN